MSNAQRLAHDPKKVRMKTICLNRCFVFARCDIAALDENLFGKGDPDRISSDGRASFLHIPTLDPSNDGRLVSR